MNRTLCGVLCMWLILGTLPVQADPPLLLMATTTSTDNTGLLDYLAPRFERSTGIRLRWVSVGTGKALELGKNCDVDVLLVHAPEAEKAFVQAGYGTDRRYVMKNDFVIVGPVHDPARIKGMPLERALHVLKEGGAVFVSRGDRSGTHRKERSLWRIVGFTPSPADSWYRETGQGMLATLRIAAERNGYTLTDRGTYIKYSSAFRNSSPPLQIVVEGDSRLMNPYGVIAVNPKHCPSVHYRLALRFIQWITSQEGQTLIGRFRLQGKPLFIPEAGPAGRR